MIGKRHALRLLAAFGAGIGLLAVGPLSSAYAASIDGGPIVTPPVASGISGTPPKAVMEVDVTSPVVTTIGANGVRCSTQSFERDLKEAPFGWPTDAWYKMTTYWCWNGVTVTSHNTSTTGGVTGFGSAEGWSYDGVQSSGYYCYVAGGSHRMCSGNTEYAQGKFQACILRLGCIASWYPFTQEWENYHGGFYHN